jgi:hypothetical protein
MEWGIGTEVLWSDCHGFSKGLMTFKNLVWLVMMTCCTTSQPTIICEDNCWIGLCCGGYFGGANPFAQASALLANMTKICWEHMSPMVAFPWKRD